jgi:hypothetical protein
MTTVRTNLGNTRERARQLRFEPTGTISSTNVQKAIEEVSGDVTSVIGPLREVTAAGDVLVSSSEGGIALNKTVGAATNVQLPPAASRGGLDVVIKDLKGDAGANNITVLPDAGDARGIDGNANDVLAINKIAQRYKPVANGWARV